MCGKIHKTLLLGTQRLFIGEVFDARATNMTGVFLERTCVRESRPVGAG
jgi:hypothetical protein